MPLFPKDHIFFILDFETTGVDTTHDYPIEIGVVVTDCEFVKIEEFQSFISWPNLIEKIPDGSFIWRQPYRKAEQIHKISALEYAGMSIKPSTVARLMLNLANHYDLDKKLILVSDNIQFEWQFLKRIMDTTADRIRRSEKIKIAIQDAGSGFTNWPWHYCGWDTSLLLDMVGDPPKETKKHRALADAQQLHQYLQRAYNLVSKWRGVRL